MISEEQARNTIQNHRIFHDHWSTKCQTWFDLWKAIAPIESTNILNIGVGEGDEAKMWMGFVGEMFPTIQHFEHLEIEEKFVKRNSKKQNPLICNVTLGDVRNIGEIYGNNSVDLLFWSQGPEHILREEWPATFKQLEDVAKVVVMQCPWGAGYDDNIYHVSKSIREGELEKFGYTCLYNGEEDTRDAGIIAYKVLV